MSDALIKVAVAAFDAELEKLAIDPLTAARLVGKAHRISEGTGSAAPKIAPAANGFKAAAKKFVGKKNLMAPPKVQPNLSTMGNGAKG